MRCHGSNFKLDYSAGGTVVTLEPASPPGTKGDANGDGSIDIVDALVTAQYYAGLSPDPFND